MASLISILRDPPSWLGPKIQSMTNSRIDDILGEKEGKTALEDSGSDRENTSSDHPTDRDPEAGITPPGPRDDGHRSPVDFDQPFDPDDPLQWSTRRKLSILVNISLLSAAGQMASSILAPSALQITADLGGGGGGGAEPNPTLAVLVVSAFPLGTAAGLLLTSGLSEAYGRAPVLHAANALSAGLACAAAAAPSLPALVGLRLLQGAAAAAAPAVGGGVIGDMFAPRERGRAAGAYGLGMLLGPAAGPVLGGYVSQRAGWRWSCWAVAIAAGAMLVGTAAVLRESYRPVVLDRRARRLRRETGGRGLVAALPRERSRLRALGTSVARPVRLLLTSPLVSLPALGLAVVFGIMFLVLSTMSTVYQQVYGWDTGASGLPYLGLGLGLFLGLGIYSATADRVYRKLAETVEPTPEMRLAPITLGAPLSAIGLVVYGWAFEKQLHWMVPIVGCVIFCQGMVAVMMPVTTYLIDAFHAKAAGPVGAASVLRCLAGGLLPLCADKLYLRLGYGWGNTMLAFIALAFAPFPYLFYKNGERLRQRFPIND